MEEIFTRGWSPDQVARLHQHRAGIAESKRLAKARQAAKDAHWLRGASELTDEALAASSRPVLTLKTVDFGNGHKESVVWARNPDPQRDLESFIDRDIDRLLKAPRGEGDRGKSKAAATRRAKQQVRYRCKSMNANSLWSLTFRQNVTDREVALKCLDEFRRRVYRVLPGWQYVAVLEQQARGAWHIHLATRALPKYLFQGGVPVKSWNVMRAVWRSAAGDFGGNFDESKAIKSRYKSATNKGRQQQMRTGAIASYIAGYAAKDFGESGFNRKRYSCSDGIGRPLATEVLHLWDGDMAEAIVMAYAALGQVITRRFFDPISKVFFVESDDSALDTVPPS